MLNLVFGLVESVELYVSVDYTCKPHLCKLAWLGLYLHRSSCCRLTNLLENDIKHGTLNLAQPT